MKNRLKFSTAGIKGFVFGLVVALLLTTSVAYANPVTRQIFFGVSVNLNGTPLQFADDSQPFIMEGRTFLPVAALGNALGVEVNWDAATSTVLITSPDTIPTPPTNGGDTPTAGLPAPVSLLQEVTVYAPGIGWGGANNSGINQDLAGRLFANSLRFPVTGAGEATFELNGEYRTVTGYLGATPSHAGGANRVSRVRFFGDGTLLGEEEITTNAPGVPFSIDVTGVETLVIVRQFLTGTGTPNVILASPQIQ